MTRAIRKESYFVSTKIDIYLHVSDDDDDDDEKEREIVHFAHFFVHFFLSCVHFHDEGTSLLAYGGHQATYRRQT
jgi:hypothetical protein